MATISYGNKTYKNVTKVLISDTNDEETDIILLFSDPNYGRVDFRVKTELLKIVVKGSINNFITYAEWGETFIFGNINKIKCNKHTRLESSKTSCRSIFTDSIYPIELNKTNNIQSELYKTEKMLSSMFKVRILKINGNLELLNINTTDMRCTTNIKGNINNILSATDLLIKGNVEKLFSNSVTYLEKK